MTLRNHYEMGNRIYLRLGDQGLSLAKFWFLLGNLAPDLCLSFLVHRHEYAASAGGLKKMMRRLFDGGLNPRSALFSYSLGIISHYVCDYFCYPHHPSFKGGLREHIAYETRQRPPPRTPRFSPNPGGGEMSFQDMTERLDRQLSRHHRGRSRGGGAYDDISPAVNAAARLGSAICFSAERLYCPRGVVISYNRYSYRRVICPPVKHPLSKGQPGDFFTTRRSAFFPGATEP